MTTARLPYEPLERILRARYDSVDWLPEVQGRREGQWHGLWRGPADATDHGFWCRKTAAVILGVEPRSVIRWARNGLSPWQADDAATRAGLHPLEIWGEDWQDACRSDETERDVTNGKRFQQPWRWPDGRRECCWRDDIETQGAVA